MLQLAFAQQRVSIVGEGSLFDEGVAHLLADRTNFLVSRAIYSDEHAFLNIIKQDPPDVILVCESGSLDPARILDIVSSHAMMMRLLVVVIRLYNNVIDVYESHMVVAGKMYFKPQRIIAETENDLLNAVRRKHNGQ